MHWVSTGITLGLFPWLCSGGLFEWEGTAEHIEATGRPIAIGDPPPRPPRLPSNAMCTFGEKAVPCVAAHNYFWDPDPVVNARGPLVMWPGDGCGMSAATVLWANVTAFLHSADNDSSGDEIESNSIIVLVRRGGCSFADKVLAILKAASSNETAVQPIRCGAIVIVDSPQPLQSGDAFLDVAPPPLTAPGFGDATGIQVPVVMVTHADAADLLPDQSSVEVASDGVVDATVSHDSTTGADSASALGAKVGVVKEGGRPLTGEVVLVSATLDSLRGRGQCQCSIEAPTEMAEWHLMHREGLKERLDFVVDEGKRALMCFSPIRTLKALAALAPQVPAYSTVGVSQALLDDFVVHVLSKFTQGPIVLVTSDYNSDRSAPKPFAINHAATLLEDPSRIAHWFSDNWHEAEKVPWSRAPADTSDRNSSSSSSTNAHDGIASGMPSQHKIVPALYWFRDELPADLPALSNKATHKGGEVEDVTNNVTPESANATTQRRSTRPTISGLPWSPHPRLTLLPIGINDRHVPGSHGDRKQLLAACRSMPPNSHRPPVALATFHHSQKLSWWPNPASGACCDRADAFEALYPFRRTHYATSHSSDTGGDANNSSQRGHSTSVYFSEALWTPQEAWTAHKDFAFEVCPQGNGVDTHRIWEALALGTIPIVRTSSIDPLFVDLPVLIVHDWAELNTEDASEKLIRWQAALAPYFNSGSAQGHAMREKLTVEHWVDLVVRTQAWLRERRV